MRKFGVLAFAALLISAPLAHAGDAPAPHKKPVAKAHGAAHTTPTKGHVAHAGKNGATAKGKKAHGTAHPTAAKVK